MKQSLRSILIMVLALAFVLPSGARGQTTDYVLGPNDLIEIAVFGQPDMSVKTRVKPDGSITVPLVGKVLASGQTVLTLARMIEERLATGGFLRKPIVDVQITDFVSRAVTVLGHVGTPGIYPLDRPLTVATALARAGGVREGGADIVILRHGGSARRLPVASLGGSDDPLLQPGDILYVPEVEMFYVYGQVTTPGAFPFHDGMTLRQALAKGGGPTLTGSERRTLLYRTGQSPAEANLDAAVQPGDVLFIKERVF